MHVGAAERAELQQEAGEPRRLLGDHPQRVLVERLERQRPRGDRGRVLHGVRVERMADRPEQAGDEAGAEEHEHRDAVRRRREHDRAEQRQRDHDHDAERELERRRHDPVRPPVAGQPRDHHRGEVDDEDVRDADARGAEEAREQQRRASDGAHDERLQQAALRVAGDDADRQEHREDDAEEERREHREPDQERARERSRVDVDVARRRDLRQLVEDVVVREPEEERGRAAVSRMTTANTLRRTASRNPYSTMTATELSPSHLRRLRDRCPRAST